MLEDIILGRFEQPQELLIRSPVTFQGLTGALAAALQGAEGIGIAGGAVIQPGHHQDECHQLGLERDRFSQLGDERFPMRSTLVPQTRDGFGREDQVDRVVWQMGISGLSNQSNELLQT